MYAGPLAGEIRGRVDALVGTTVDHRGQALADRDLRRPRLTARRRLLRRDQRGGPMLIEQTLDKLNAMNLGAMADACHHQLDRRGRRPRFRGALRPAHLRRVDGPRATQAAAAAPHRQTAPSGDARGRRLHPPAAAQPPAGPGPPRLRLDRRAPRPAADRPNRHRQELPRVCVRRTGLPPRLHRALRPDAAPAARAGRRPQRRVLRPAPDSPRQARPARHRRLDDRAAARR